MGKGGKVERVEVEVEVEIGVGVGVNRLMQR